MDARLMRITRLTLFAILCLAPAACADEPTSPRTPHIRDLNPPIALNVGSSGVATALANGGAYAESSYMACIHSYVDRGCRSGRSI